MWAVLLLRLDMWALNDGSDLDGQRERLESHKQESGEKNECAKFSSWEESKLPGTRTYADKSRRWHWTGHRQSKITGWGWLESWPEE